MMKVRNFFRNLPMTLQRLANNLTKGCERLFKPTDDDYPKTGVQPFEGEISR